MTDRPPKITLGEMRASGVRGVLIDCADFKCGHWIKINADQWPDETRLSDLEDKVRLHGVRKARCRCQAGFQMGQEKIGGLLIAAARVTVQAERRDRPYQAGRSKRWVKIKNRRHPAMDRVMEACR